MVDVNNLKKIGTINLAPTPEGYARTLCFILVNGDFEGKKWAEAEIIKLVKAAASLNPEAWGKEKE
jgi:hypothetical protein